jgi:hypothetical protein
MLVTPTAPAPGSADDRGAERRRARRREVARLAVVFLLAALVWCAQAGLWTAAAWRLPSAYRGDSFEVLARIQAASDGDLAPWESQRIERLGAPYGANWSSYPMPEKVPIYLLGQVARVTDVFVASNVGMAVAFGLAAAMFYWVVRRWLRVGWEWAAVGGLLFAFTYSIVHRGLAHYSFVLTWVVPLGLVACWLVARRAPLRRGGPELWWCVAAGAAMGCHNTYYLFFWLQLIALALLVQWLNGRHRPNLVAGGAAIAAALVMFGAANWDYWLSVPTDETMPLLQRNYGGTERYALKPVEMFIPPTVHRWSTLAFLGHRYGRWSEWKGEEFLPYLGLCGVIAAGLLLWRAVPRLLRGRRVPGTALAVGWLLAFASIGGLTNFLSFFGGFFLFRASNRIVIFIVALLLVFLVVRLSRWTAHWRAPWRLAAALAVAAVGLFDQLPRSEAEEARGQVAAAVDSDRRFVAAVEARLGREAALFQLPVLGFPEVAPPWKLSDYEHFRPYLNSEGLRFSYGVPKMRPRGRWQSDTERLPVPEMVRRLESYGFAALYLNRRGFEDGGEGLLAALEAAGYTERLQSPLGAQVVVPLRPAATPKKPLARSLTPGVGWQPRIVDGVRWAQGPATLLFYNPHAQAQSARLVLNLEVPWEQQLVLRRDEETLTTRRVVPGTTRLEVPGLTLRPGLNAFVLVGEAKRGGGAGSTLRAVGLMSSQVELTPRPDSR